MSDLCQQQAHFAALVPARSTQLLILNEQLVIKPLCIAIVLLVEKPAANSDLESSTYTKPNGSFTTSKPEHWLIDL